MQAGPGESRPSRHTLGLPDYSGELEALAEPFPIQAASGPRCGPPVAKAGRIESTHNVCPKKVALMDALRKSGSAGPAPALLVEHLTALAVPPKGKLYFFFFL